MKTLTQLDKWNKDIEQLTDMAENASSAKLFKYYRGALIDIKKQMKAYIDDYDSLSFAKRLEADRLISVGAQIDKTLKETYGNAKGEIVGHSTISAENGYYGTWYALEGNENVQLDMAFLDKKYIHQLIYKEVAGATFSTRLYKERDKLATATKQALLNATRDGKGYGHAAKAVEEATEASYKQALRIMRTEGGRARSEATQKSYVNAEKNGVTLEKQWIATLDKKTRRAHGELDGQRVPVKGKFKIDGHSADGPRLFKFPALDINCRCSTISVVNGIAPEVRRTKDGVVPFQSYQEWAESKGIKTKKVAAKPKEKGLFDGVVIGHNLTRDEAIKGLSEKFGMAVSETGRTKLSDVALNQTYSILEAFDGLYNKLPKIPQVRAVSKSEAKRAMAWYSHEAKGNTPVELGLNALYFKNMNQITESVKRNVATGWFSKNSNPNRVMIHEFSHHLDFQLTEIYGSSFSDLVFGNMFKKHGDKYYPPNISGSICNYADSYYRRTRKNTEAFAELFAEAYGDTPRQIAKDFREQFEKVAKEVLDNA